VHATGGWLAPGAVMRLGAWILTVGWFDFHVMSAQPLERVSGLVAMNSLMAMAAGTPGTPAAGRADPGFLHDGPLAGLVAVCAGSDVMHPLGSLAVATLAGRAVHGAIRATIGLWLDEVAESDGADLAIHRISSTPR